MILESTFFSLNWERSLISDQIKEKYGLNADLGIQIKTHTHTHTNWHNAWAHPLAYLCRFQRHYTQTHSYIYERMHQLEMVNNELKSTHFKTTCQVSESTAIAAYWFNKIWAKFSPGTDAKKKKKKGRVGAMKRKHAVSGAEKGLKVVVWHEGFSRVFPAVERNVMGCPRHTLR